MFLKNGEVQSIMVLHYNAKMFNNFGEHERQHFKNIFCSSIELTGIITACSLKLCEKKKSSQI